MQGYRFWLGDRPQDEARNIAWNNGACLFGLPTPSAAPDLTKP
jgi:hypothetical protein